MRCARATRADVLGGGARRKDVLWTLVPSLFYPAPPGDVPLVLAIGKRMAARRASGAAARPIGSPTRRTRLAGGSVDRHSTCCSQTCVVQPYWAVFSLARRIVGAALATMAILLMAGITCSRSRRLSSRPPVLAMPLTALTLLFGYRALAEGRIRHWIGVRRHAGPAAARDLCGPDAGRACWLVFILGTRRGRSQLKALGPLIAAATSWW